MIVLFAARGNGFSGSVTSIISLNTRAKVGASLLALSTTGLEHARKAFGGKNSERDDAPYLVPKLY